MKNLIQNLLLVDPSQFLKIRPLIISSHPKGPLSQKILSPSCSEKSKFALFTIREFSRLQCWMVAVISWRDLDTCC